MKLQDLAFLGCRLLALYWGVMAIHWIGGFAAAWAAWDSSSVTSRTDMLSLASQNTALLSLHILIALALWFGARRFARFMAPDTGAPKESGGITLVEVQAAAFAAVGLLIVLTSLPEAVSVLYQLHRESELRFQSEMSWDAQFNRLELIIRLVLGVLLFFGARGLSGLLVRLRKAGVR